MIDPQAQKQIDAGLWFEHAISGVTMPSRDGYNRQELVRGLKVGDELEFVREPKNKYDKNATLLRRMGQPGALGYVSAKAEEWGQLPGGLVAWLAPRLDRGEEWRVFVRKVVGDDPRAGKESVGCRITVVQISGSDMSDTPGKRPLRGHGSDSYYVRPKEPSEAMHVMDDLQHVRLTSDERRYVDYYAMGVRRFGDCPIAILSNLKLILARGTGRRAK
jgi:HIRAN domain